MTTVILGADCVVKCALQLSFSGVGNGNRRSRELDVSTSHRLCCIADGTDVTYRGAPMTLTLSSSIGARGLYWTAICPDNVIFSNFSLAQRNKSLSDGSMRVGTILSLC